MGAAGVALVGASVIGLAPTLAASPQLMATLHYLRGTNIGDEPSEQEFQDFIGVVLDGTGTTPPDAPYEKVPYNSGFWPFSHGGFGDLTYNSSVDEGVELLQAQEPAAGDVIFGFSQGAVSASKYKGTHSGNTYFLVANPSRPNGGVMQRFEGWTIPFIDVTFSGATPNNGLDGAPGDLTFDITRQYDGWGDFPRYLWNPVAIANAIMGIALVHGKTQTELTVADLEAAEAAGSDYYQIDSDSNTVYYVIRTYPVPLLMPLQAILPAPIIAALDAPLRAFIETAYDRTDYAAPTRATLFEPFESFGQADELNTATSTSAAEDPPAARAATGLVGDETGADPHPTPAPAEPQHNSRDADDQVAGSATLVSLPEDDPGPDHAQLNSADHQADTPNDGETGETGATGETGDTGETRETGETGATGAPSDRQTAVERKRQSPQRDDTDKRPADERPGNGSNVT